MLNMCFRNTEKPTCQNETLHPCFNQIIGLHEHASCRTLVCMFVGYTNRQMKRLLKQVPSVRHCFMCNEISGETRHVITGDGTLWLSLSGPYLGDEYAVLLQQFVAILAASQQLPDFSSEWLRYAAADQ